MSLFPDSVGGSLVLGASSLSLALLQFLYSSFWCACSTASASSQDSTRWCLMSGPFTGGIPDIADIFEISFGNQDQQALALKIDLWRWKRQRIGSGTPDTRIRDYKIPSYDGPGHSGGSAKGCTISGTLSRVCHGAGCSFGAPCFGDASSQSEHIRSRLGLLPTKALSCQETLAAVQKKLKWDSRRLQWVLVWLSIIWNY
jgi:hypothetical protein